MCNTELRHPGNRSAAEVIRDPVAAVEMPLLDPGSARLRRLAGMTPEGIALPQGSFSHA
jgi:hypothetical protein